MALARQYGVYETARALPIHYGALKQHLEAADRTAVPRERSRFVELTPMPPTACDDSVIEVDRPRATVRIRVRGMGLTDLARTTHLGPASETTGAGRTGPARTAGNRDDRRRTGSAHLARPRREHAGAGGQPDHRRKVRLGRSLFFDRRLSRDGSLSCSTCHDPNKAFADERTVSVGVFGQRGPRNVPTLVNRSYGAASFWDGRMPTLERQVVAPIENRDELDMTLEEVVARLKHEPQYVVAFRAAFNREPRAGDLARALATYVRSILAGDTPVDRYLAGDRGALDPPAQAGLRLFRGRANCTACHLGPTFTDERFHNTGVAWRPPTARVGRVRFRTKVAPL